MLPKAYPVRAPVRVKRNGPRHPVHSGQAAHRAVKDQRAGMAMPYPWILR